MTIKTRNIFLASAALAFVAAQSPAIAGDFDPTIDFGSLKAEYAAKDAGASFGDKRRAFTTSSSQGFTASAGAATRSYGSSKDRRADFNTTRDWR